MTVFDFTVKGVDGASVSLSAYRGKVLLIVNTATGCGFTPQYKELQELYEKYAKNGFEILDFPCNQFGNQAPGGAGEIESFCTLRYGTTFPRFAKLEVNGKNADPLFTFLKSQRKGLLGGGIKWNFTKFLIGRDGRVVRRFAPSTSPGAIEADLAAIL